MFNGEPYISPGPNYVEWVYELKLHHFYPWTLADLMFCYSGGRSTWRKIRETTQHYHFV